MSLCLLLATLLFSPAAALAGTGAVYRPPSAQTSAYPARGMTMAQVRERFGMPERTLPPDPATAQGPLKPPVVRWIYPHFTVYFERGFVIHSVLTHPRYAPSPDSSAGGSGLP